MSAPIEELDPREARALKERGEVTFLDVREHEELELATIADALHVPMGEIPERLGELDEKRPLVVFCHHGMRSYRVAEYLKKQGFDDVRNLAGGIDGWSSLVDSDVPRY